jgi:phosphoribosylaminoimidazole (AIR) synthetase
MGLGFCVVVKDDDVEKALKICAKQGTKGYIIGTVVKESGVRVKDFVLTY